MEGEIIGREKLRMKDVTIKPPKKTIEQVIWLWNEKFIKQEDDKKIDWSFSVTKTIGEIKNLRK
jgi:hypothetical protein